MHDEQREANVSKRFDSLQSSGKVRTECDDFPVLMGVGGGGEEHDDSADKLLLERFLRPWVLFMAHTHTNTPPMTSG